MKTRQFARYAVHGIRRGGERVWIAILAVAFGVMSLIAMASVSESIGHVLLVHPRYEIGGDAWLWREARYLSAQDLAQIEALATEGAIAQWAPVSDSPTLMLKIPGSGRVTFLRDGIGFEPGRYPMVGQIVLRSKKTLDQALQQPGDVIVTRDIAEARGLHVGDAVLIGNQLGGEPRTCRVAGIAVETPAYHGSTLYYDLQTAALIDGRPDPITNVAVLWGQDDPAVRATLKESGWRIYAPDTISERTKQLRATFDMMLKGAGLLGLTVGGIGIANTMRVLLARRRQEIAVLKSLGYARRHIMAVLILESALIGLAGSVVGAALGVGLSAALVQMASNVVTLFITWQIDPLLVAGGIALGVASAVLFGASAILRASDVRPADVLRQLPPAPRRRLRASAILALLSVPLCGMASLVLGSIWQGAALLGGMAAGLLAVGGTLLGIKWVVLRLLPTFRLYLLRMARNNLRRRAKSMVFAMVALCIGTFTLGLSMVIISGSQEQLDLQMYAAEGYNLVVLTNPARAAEAERAAAAVSDRTGVRYEVPLRSATTENGLDLSEQIGASSLQGRDALWDVAVTGAPWGSVPRAAYLPAGLDLAAQRLVVTDFQGRQLALKVAGTYEVVGEWNRFLLPEPEGILVSGETVRALESDDAYALAAAEVPPRQLEAMAQQVSAAVPDMMVVTAADLNDAFKSTFRNLSTFAVAMAGLALAAGGVLIANAVSLAMLERGREIGVLKAMGYTRAQVLRAILFEYGLIGTIASGVGLVGVIAFVVVLAWVQEITEGILTVGLVQGITIFAVAVGLTLSAALAAAWKPTSARPRAVLSQAQ